MYIQAPIFFHSQSNKILTIHSNKKNQSHFILSLPAAASLFLPRVKLQLQLPHGPGAHEDGDGASKHNQRLAQGRRQRVVVGDDQLAVAEVVHQVAAADDEGGAAEGVEERAVDLDVGRRDGLSRDRGVELDVSGGC